MDDRLRVGVIASTHGLRGEVKVFPTTDDPKRFKTLKTLILDIQPNPMALTVESVKFFTGAMTKLCQAYSLEDVMARHADLID